MSLFYLQFVLCLVLFSRLENLWHLSVNIFFAFLLMKINNFSFKFAHLWLVQNERTSILLFWTCLVIGRKKLGGPSWVCYTVIFAHMCIHKKMPPRSSLWYILCTKPKEILENLQMYTVHVEMQLCKTQDCLTE